MSKAALYQHVSRETKYESMAYGFVQLSLFVTHSGVEGESATASD